MGEWKSKWENERLNVRTEDRMGFTYVLISLYKFLKKEILKMFGGPLDITTFRNNMDSSTFYDFGSYDDKLIVISGF